MTDMEEQAQKTPGFTWSSTAGGGDRKPPVPEGTYLAHLMRISNGTKKEFKNRVATGRVDASFVWEFMLYPDLNKLGEGRGFNLNLKQSNLENSNLYKLLKVLNGHAMPAEALIPGKLVNGKKAADPGYMMKMMAFHVGKWFMLPVVVSEDGQWNNIGDIDAIKEVPAPDKRASDEIPF